MKPENVADWVCERIYSLVVIIMCMITFLVIPTLYYESKMYIENQNTTMLKRVGSMIFGIDIN